MQQSSGSGPSVGTRREWSFERYGVEVLRGVLDPATITQLREWVSQLEEDAGASEVLALHHHEATEDGVALARSERFADTHAALGDFVRVRAAELVGGVLGDEVVLYKEKVNHKRPGGAGFAAHQDARAYRFVDWHVSAMVPVDPATLDSGCLWFARHQGRDLLADDGRGRLAPDVEDFLEWEPLEAMPGDVVVFDSLAPHRSGTNLSALPRRVMYLTYNRRLDGDHRERYYDDKAAEFAANDGTFGRRRARISISDDFLGRPVDSDAPDSAPTAPSKVLSELYSTDAAAQLYDEAVTECEHGLQAAALAENEGAAEEMVAAALLHDVGHLLVGDLRGIDEELPGDEHHEAVGARYLRRWFGPGLTDPIAMHVAAKRYLCAVDPRYLESLSPSSARSLAVQGGPMTVGEASAFEGRSFFEEAVILRLWDDEAKVVGAMVPDFAHYADLLDRLAASGPGQKDR